MEYWWDPWTLDEIHIVFSIKNQKHFYRKHLFLALRSLSRKSCLSITHIITVGDI